MNLEEMASRLEIQDVLLRYVRGLDRLDMGLVRGCFHADALVQFPGSLHVGPLGGFMEFVSNQMPVFVRTSHFLAPSLIEFDGPTIAHVETYQLAGSEFPAGSQGADKIHWKGDFVTLWSRYIDRFELRDGVWLIARRRLVEDWMFKDANQGSFDANATNAGRDGSDPVVRPVAGFTGTPTTIEEWP